MKSPGQVFEGALHPLACHEDDFINTGGVIKSLPGVGHHRPAGDLQKELVEVPPHAGSLAGGDDDGAGHSSFEMARAIMDSKVNTKNSKLDCRPPVHHFELDRDAAVEGV